MGGGRVVQALAVVGGSRHTCTGSTLPLLRRVESWGGVQFELTSDPERLTRSPSRALLLSWDGEPLTGEQCDGVAGVLRGGGTVVTLRSGLAALQSFPDLPRAAVVLQTEPAEVVLRADISHPLLAGWEPDVTLADSLTLSAATGRPLLWLDWRGETYVVASDAQVLGGRLVHIGLGWMPEAYSHPALAGLIHRSFVSAVRPALPAVRVGLLGYGAIAREHAGHIGATEGLEVGAVCDTSQARRAAAEGELGARTYTSIAQLLDDDTVDTVLVGTPPNDHAQSSIAALRAGKHVICEKPFALTQSEGEAMIEAAAAAGRVLTVYQCRRWDADFLAVQDLARRGVLGDIFYHESFIGEYAHPCRYWHSHAPVSGGMIYDWGSHYLDWLLQLVQDQVRTVRAVAHKLVWHDVTNADQVRVDIGFAGGGQAVFLQSAIAAAPKPKWYILGTRAAVVAQWRAPALLTIENGALAERDFAPADVAAEVWVHRPDGRGRAHRELISLPDAQPRAFYRNLRAHLAFGEPLAVTPQQSLRNVRVMEAATRSISEGGLQLPVSI